jgi:hypothetical protein
MNANRQQMALPATDPGAAPFVINLCASTSPLALVHPTDPALKRHTFFVTRHREEGRERFRLHMGYFATQQEAETLLAAVREIYPAAWVGPAPTSGSSRRGRGVSAPIPVAAAATAAVTTAVAPAKFESTLSVGAESPAATPVAVASAPAPAPVAMDLAPPLTVPTLAAVAPRLPASLKSTPAQIPASAPVRPIKPERTQVLGEQTMGEAERDPPYCFAVQLLWSATPIDVAAHPHLAIFEAYTLYGIQGTRQGQRWHGLRLGFFKDPNAATQVAQYVRPDYPGVAVVPVVQKERVNATRDTAAIELPQKSPSQTSIERGGLEIELLVDDRPVPVKRDVDDMTAKPSLKASGKPVGKRIVVRKPEQKDRVTPGATMPVDETFERLGASTLTIDETHEGINNDALRKKSRPPVGRLSRLLGRLAGR